MVNPEIKTKAYFDSISRFQIDQKLGYLIHELPKKSTKSNYQLSYKLLGIDVDTVTEDNLQSKLQEVADRMRAHLQIKRSIKILTLSNVEAGKFERIDGLNCIYINGDLIGQNVQQKIAILAHEMSHYYLIYQHNILLPDVDENELLTELNAIYVGFGFLLLEGYEAFEKRTGNKIQTSKVGYIKVETIKKVIVKTAYYRKQNPMWILKNIRISNLLYFTSGLFYLIRDYYKLKFRNSKFSNGYK